MGGRREHRGLCVAQEKQRTSEASELELRIMQLSTELAAVQRELASANEAKAMFRSQAQQALHTISQMREERLQNVPTPAAPPTPATHAHAPCSAHTGASLCFGERCARRFGRLQSCTHTAAHTSTACVSA